MKLSSLHLRNWRGIADREIQLSSTEPTIFTGPNGSCKTSILNAIEWLFTDKNPTGQPRDAGLLREGQKIGWVGAKLAGGAPIQRNLPGGGLDIEGLPKKAGVYAAEQKLMALAGVSSAAEVGRAFRTDIFLALAAKEQQEAWYEILGMRIDEAVVTEKLAAKEVATKLPVVATYKDVCGTVSSNLDAAHTKLFAKRRDKKKELKEATAVLDQITGAEADGKAPAFKQAPDAEKKASLEQRRDELTREIGGILSGESRRKSQLQRAEGLRIRLAKAFDADRIARNEAALAGVRAQIEKLASPAARVRKLQAEIDGAGATCCPTCSRPWSDGAERAAKLMELTKEQEAAKRQVAEEAALRERVSKGEALLREQRSLEAAREQLADIETELSTFSKVDPASLELELNAVRDQLKTLDAQAQAAQASTDWLKRKAEASNLVTALSKEVETLEVLVEMFGARGIKAEVLRAASEPVGEQLSGTLANWGMAARLNTDLQLEVERDDKWRLAASCSDGERILLALALQVWLATHSGTRIVLIDRLEALDDENQRILIAACEQLLESGAIDHAFLAGVDLGSRATVSLDPSIDAQLLEV